MKPVINTEKHYVQFPVFTVPSTTVGTAGLVSGDNSLANARSVRVGAVVKAVYVEFWADSATASKTINAMVLKQPSGAAAPTYAEMQNLTAYKNKKNIFEFHQGLNPSNGNIIPLFRQWVMIPKGKQRIGIGDDINFLVSATGATMNVCGFAVFKEQF